MGKKTCPCEFKVSLPYLFRRRQTVLFMSAIYKYLLQVNICRTMLNFTVTLKYHILLAFHVSTFSV